MNFNDFLCSHQRFTKKAVLKNFAIFTEKHLSWGLFLKKLQTFRRFLVNIAKLLRAPTLKNFYELLLLDFFQLKLTIHSILHYLWSADIIKSFSQLIVFITTGVYKFKINNSKKAIQMFYHVKFAFKNLLLFSHSQFCRTLGKINI